MKLKRLIVQGFKSFKDRTIINFDDGITGIVGPNGCGKSNIVDALFWVMGEMSAKHLRGNSMKDLIFAGSSKYTPGSFAEATLVLDNDSGKHIHIGNKVSSPSEIQLTRKLYRNGETEYRINNEPARLKDIQEVFMDTGAGAKSYSIIAQGEINKLVQQKPEERRVMIEEVAGITKFKMRKRESMRKIDATQANLARLSDLQIEIEKNLRALQKQAEKAERARSLKNKIQRNDLVVNAHKVYDHLKNYRDEKNTIDEKNLEVEGWKTRKESLEIGLEDERLQKDEKTEKIEELQKEYNEISKQLAGAEEKLNYLCKSQTEKENLIEQKQKEITEIETEIENRTKRHEELIASREEIESAHAQEFDFSSLEEKVEQLKEDLELKQDESSQLSDEVEEAKLELNEVEQTISRNSSRMEDFSASLQDITVEIEALEKQYSGVSQELANERDAVASSAKKVEELEVKEAQLRSSVEETKLQYKENSEKLNTLNKEFIQKESKLQSLIEINESLEGAKEGAINFINQVESEEYKLFGTLIKCDEKYAQAAQLVFSDFMNTIVSSGSDITNFWEWTQSQSEEGIDLLIPSSEMKISEESIERLRLKGCEGLVSFNDIIELPVEFKSKLAPVLEGYFVVDQVDQKLFESLSPEINFRAIVDINGKGLIKNIGGAKILEKRGNQENTQGIVERNNLIEELKERITVLNNEISGLGELVETQKNELDTHADQHDQTRTQLSDERASHASIKSALESRLSGMESGQTRLEILKNRKSEVSKQRLELIESEESLESKKNTLDEKTSELVERQESLVDDLELLRNSYNENKEVLVEKQVEARSYSDRVESVTSQITDIEGQLERLNTRLDSANEVISKYEEEIQTIEEDLKALEESNSETANILLEKEEVLNLYKDDLVQLLQDMKEREDQVKSLSQEINSNEKTVATLEAKIGLHLTEEEQTVKNIFEKYRIDLRDTLGRYLEYTEDDYKELSDISTMYFMETEEGMKEIEKESYEFNRRYGQDLKDCSVKLKNYKNEFARLGEINWQAIEDYERQKLRFDFLKVQEAELKQSLEDLEKAIGHIDEKSRQRFAIAFEEVNTRFQKVFPIIFGGGSAQLKVIGQLEDPECGVEIIAQPPGKKMQNINLMSGGEKAMTAVSLIFSIFLVKPSPFCLLDEVDAPLDDANVGRFNELLREMSAESQFILITHNKKTMELNDTLYGVTMQEPGISKAVSVQLH